MYHSLITSIDGAFHRSFLFMLGVGRAREPSLAMGGMDGVTM